MLISIFFLSGFVIITRYYKKKDNKVSMTLIEKIIFISSLSLAIAILLGLFLGYLGWFSMISFLISYVIIIVILIGLSFLLD
jgi:uncharacterized membrane protein